MLRHDAFRTLDVSNGKVIDDKPVMLFPLPVVGPHSPNVLSLRLLVTIAIFVVPPLLLLRWMEVASPGVARVLVCSVCGLLAVTLVVRWCSSGFELTDWSGWIGAGVLLALLGFVVLPILQVLSNGRTVVTRGVLPGWAEIALLAFLLVPAMAPLAKIGFLRQSREVLTIALVMTWLGAAIAANSYYPESDFGAWTFVTRAVITFFPCTGLIAGEYSRFQLEMARNSVNEKLVAARYGVGTSLWGLAWLLACIWAGNAIFIAFLDSSAACIQGMILFGIMLIMAGRSIKAPWDALTFWLTYNLQGVYSNPNAFQCRRPFQSPTLRYAIVAFGFALFSLSMFHLTGERAQPNSNRDRLASSWVSWHRMLPQGYPELLQSDKSLSTEVKAILKAHAEALVNDGDPPLRPERSGSFISTLTRIVVCMFLTPVMFFAVFACSQGPYLAALMAPPRKKK